MEVGRFFGFWEKFWIYWNGMRFLGRCGMTLYRSWEPDDTSYPIPDVIGLQFKDGEATNKDVSRSKNGTETIVN